MKNILYIIILLFMFSCTQKELSFDNSETVETSYNVEEDGVVYPSTNMDAMTRISYNGNVDWVNGTKVTLPNGEEVDLPWVDGGSLPFFMQKKLSPDNGWELVAHTMAPDTQSNRSYLVFHNYITGTLRVFCYMSTFATNNNGFWKITFSEPTALLNFGSISSPMDERYTKEIVVSNATTQDGKGFALGWNGFQLELSYDPKSSGIMKFEPMNVNTTEINMEGESNSMIFGSIVNNSSSSTVASDLISGVGKVVGEEAESYVKTLLPGVSNIPIVGNGLLSLVKGGISSIFGSFSGLFDKKTTEIMDVNLTTRGYIKVRGTAITPTAAPIAAVNINLGLIDGKLGAWNIEQEPYLTWCTTVCNDFEANKNVTDRQYFYETPGSALLMGTVYNVKSNPKLTMYYSSMTTKFVRYLNYTYKIEGGMKYGSSAIRSKSGQKILYKEGLNGPSVIELPNPCLRVRICVIDCPTSENLPYSFELAGTKIPYVIRELDPHERMDVFMQFTYHADITINGVVNEYCATRTYQCKSGWGDAY